MKIPIKIKMTLFACFIDDGSIKIINLEDKATLKNKREILEQVFALSYGLA